MPLLWALVGLICHFSCETLAVPTAGTRNECNRKTGLKEEYDIREALCYENKLFPGEGRLCGGQAYNPEEATCCIVEDGDTKTAVTKGLSAQVSSCCGLKAYDQLNEMCCQSAVVAKSAPNAKCCGQNVINKDTELCCGPNKTILSRQSSDHLCCGNKQFNNKTECCCVLNNSLEIRHRGSSCCEEESAFCGLKTYNTVKELCCELTVVAKHAPNAQCCDQNAFNKDTELCCGENGKKTILSRQSRDHLCCGNKQFNNKTECCCVLNNSLEIRHRGSSCCEEESAFCGLKTYNTVKELCCELTVVAKHAPKAQCCDQNVFNKDTELCCGEIGKKTILSIQSRDHLCCGNKQFNNKTECCCVLNNSLEIRHRGSSCCEEESGVQQQIPTSQLNCTEPNTSFCGSTCYNPRNFLCCEKNPRGSQRISSPEKREKAVLVQLRRQGSEPHPAPFMKQHCCGTGAHQPHTEICCNGHRHFKTENTHCCGVKAYNIKDPQMKCCAGTLHNLTLLGYDARCCGSILETPQKTVCCSGEDKQVLYSAKTGFGCCGHRYYNASLWSCCAENLNPIHHPGQRQSGGIIEVKLLSVNNLNDAHLCYQMHIGIMESLGQNGIAFRSVLKIHGRNATVTPLDSPLILKTPDRCSFPKLIPGKFYFFDKVHVFTDFNHDSILLSLHSLISKCYHP